MNLGRRHINRFFLVSVLVLTAVGFTIFLSASLGLLAQNSTSSFIYTALKQSISLIIGLIVFFVLSRTDYTLLHRSAFYIFLTAIIINLLIFIPQISILHGGATRWIDLGFFSFQPSEFLKIAFIIYAAAWLQYVKDRIKTINGGLLPYIVLIAILSILLLAQKDTDTLVIIIFTGLVMFFIAGMPLKHIAILGVIFGIIIGCVILLRPYALERVKTFLNRGSDTQGSGYQINQSMIAIGSGQIIGRGFGKSIQKFGYLPQPTNDSIFAVAAEEFGFIGSFILVMLYVIFAVSCFRVGTRCHDPFGAYVAIGISILIVTESFLNMLAMLGLVPLFGVPLLFVSHGGTALIITLAAAGIVANISKHMK